MTIAKVRFADFDISEIEKWKQFVQMFGFGVQACPGLTFNLILTEPPDPSNSRLSASLIIGIVWKILYEPGRPEVDYFGDQGMLFVRVSKICLDQ